MQVQDLRRLASPFGQGFRDLDERTGHHLDNIYRDSAKFTVCKIHSLRKSKQRLEGDKYLTLYIELFYLFISSLFPFFFFVQIIIVLKLVC